MLNHISLVGGEWNANLRDNTTFVYMLIQAKRGAARITHFEPEPSHSLTYVMGNGDYAYETRFKYVSPEDRLQAAKDNEARILVK